MANRLFPALFCVAALVQPALAQERQWTLDASGEDAYLIFGVPDTDDVGISFWCPIQQGEVNVFLPNAVVPSDNGADVPVTISTDEDKAEFAGKVEPNPESDGASVEARMPADHPILSSMMASDRFRVKAGEQDTVFPLYDADLRGLMELCRKP